MQDTGSVTFLYSLERKGSNDSSTNTTSIFGSEDFYWVFFLGILLGGPVKNLSKGLGSSCLEMRVFVKDGTISTNMAGLEVLLGANCGNSTG